VLLAGGCGVAPEPLTAEDAAANVAGREASISEATKAISLSGLQPLFREPPDADPNKPDRAAIWHACAWAYATGPAVARRRYLAARAAAGSTGLPGPIGLSADSLSFEDIERETTVRLTFDLLGLLGLGRSAAAERLANAEVRRAYAGLEQAAWAARFAVDTARVRVAASRARIATLETLLGEVDADIRRVEILDARGWLPPGQTAGARAMAKQVHARIAVERAELAHRLSDLSQASGLPPDSGLLAGVSTATFDDFEPLREARPLPGAVALSSERPGLRARRLDYALAEARLQRAAAEAWPEIRLGPRLRAQPNETLVGGVLDLSLPWPGSVTGSVQARQHERELARELFENALVEALADARALRDALQQAQVMLRRHGPKIEARTRAAWTAVRARFSVDARALPMWTDRLERRIGGSLAAVDARERAIVALLAYAEAIGPEAR